MGEHHQYGKQPDLRQLLNGSSHFQGGTPHVTHPIFVHGRNLNLEPAAQTHYDPTMAGGFMLPSGLVKHGHPDDRCSTNPANVVASAAPSSSASARTVATTGYSGPGRTALYGVELMDSGWIIGNDHSHGGINSRWPRQETLTLLDIRSRLDSRFKEANQKSPLWDEVSRIMAEEHGYQRSGRKCREKFENLYKYYKKTKDGKAGRQDGKHYRFFRQLEALYGETSNETSVSQSHLVNNPLFYQARPANIISRENLEPFTENKQSDSLSFSNTSEFDQTSSSENNDDDLSAIACMMNRSSEKQKGIAEKRCKSKVKNFVDSEMRKVFETQEAWMERTLKTIEDRENERMCRDEEWMKEEAARFNQEREFWAKQIQWIEARDAALVETLKRCTGKQLGLSLSVNKINIAPETDQIHKQNQEIDAETIRNYQEMTHFRWTEAEILSLIQLRSAVETKFQEGGYPGERLWDEIATNMTSLGYDRSINECIEKWDNMNIYFNMSRECNKKRNEDLTTDNYYWELETYNAQESHEKQVPEIMENIPFGSGSSKAAFRFQ